MDIALRTDLAAYLDERRREVDAACDGDTRPGRAAYGDLSQRIMTTGDARVINAWLTYLDADAAVRAEVALIGEADCVFGAAKSWYWAVADLETLAGVAHHP